MKTLKPRPSARPSPKDALAVAAQIAPDRPPAVLASPDQSTTLNLRLRSATIRAITAVARKRGLTLKQVVCQSLAAEGVQVDPVDLEDRTPRRRT